MKTTKTPLKLNKSLEGKAMDNDEIIHDVIGDSKLSAPTERTTLLVNRRELNTALDLARTDQDKLSRQAERQALKEKLKKMELGEYGTSIQPYYKADIEKVLALIIASLEKDKAFPKALSQKG